MNLQGLEANEERKNSDIIPLTYGGVKGYFITQDTLKDYIQLQQFQLMAIDNEKLYLQTIELYKAKINIYQSLQVEYDKAVKDYQKQQQLNNILRYTTEAGFILSGLCIAGLVSYIALSNYIK